MMNIYRSALDLLASILLAGALAPSDAGVDPIPVEDCFYLFAGNIHCTLVPLQ